jgi:hypothetical protein
MFTVNLLGQKGSERSDDILWTPLDSPCLTNVTLQLYQSENS